MGLWGLNTDFRNIFFLLEVMSKVEWGCGGLILALEIFFCFLIFAEKSEEF